MGLPINIEKVLAGESVEWERLEFKRGWNPEDVLHTLCAFANDFHNLDGGYIIVGVAEKDGQALLPPVGLSLSSLDMIQRKLEELGRLIQPTYHPITEPYVVQEKHILVLRATGGQNRPYKAPISLAKGEKAFGYYIRRNSCTVKAGASDEADLFALAAKVPFDDRTRQDATLNDLEMPLILAHLTEIESGLANDAARLGLDETARKMGIVDGPSEDPRPRNVGLMFFNENPERFFPQAQIDVVQYPDGPGGDTIIEKTFRGPVSKQLNTALDYIKSTIIETYVIKRSDRAQSDRVYNYPYPAIEEILVNAAYHRSYEDREPIEVRVLPDHVTITSYPGPDRSISLEDLKSGHLIARRYRNRRMGEFLKELHLTEGRGTGIPKVIRAMQQNGSPTPRFQTDEDRSYFTAILPIRSGGAIKNGGENGGTPTFTPVDRTTEILLICREPQTRASLQGKLGLKDSKHLRERYIYPMVMEGFLKLGDPANPRAHDQTYQTTPRGLDRIDLASPVPDPSGQFKMGF